jgi:ubiquinone/menaquinone biosynthesis C-methylase UbiE
MADLLVDGPVLDVPAGSALITAKALQANEHASLIVAVDLSHQMLRRGCRRLGARAVYVQADVCQLPFRRGAFASVHSSNGFHLFADASGAARELARVSRPGGSVVVTAWTDQGHIIARLYQRLLARLGHIEQARPADVYVTTLEAEGLRTETMTVTGTLMRWNGHKPS